MIDLTISVVSHNHGELLNNTLKSLENALVRSGLKYEIIITFNVTEEIENLIQSQENIITIRNVHPKGFGANHNTAFKKSKGIYFIVCNPDIEVPRDFNFRKLLNECPQSGILSPKVVSPVGTLEDFYRNDVSISNLIRRRLGFVELSTNEFKWFAGIFLVFPASTFYAVDGFDEGYFMYVEDCDICKRVSNLNGEIRVSTQQHLIHYAQRKSGQSIKHTLWHIKSLIRYWLKPYWKKSL